MNTRTATIGLSSLVLLGMMGFFGTHVSRDINMVFALFYGLVVFLPFYGFPPIVSIILSIKMKNAVAQVILSIASLLYGAWFAGLMIYSRLHPDPQGGLIVLFVGIYFLPVLLPLWIAAWTLNSYHMKKHAENI